MHLNLIKNWEIITADRGRWDVSLDKDNESKQVLNWARESQDFRLDSKEFNSLSWPYKGDFLK